MHMTETKNHQETVRFVQVNSIAAQIELVYQKLKSQIQHLLPESEIRHIGSTSIPDSLSKGDLDVLVMVKTASFEGAEQTLSKLFEDNSGTEATHYFHSYVSTEHPIEVGIQLKTIDSKWPCFLLWQKRLLEDINVRNEYDDLKRSFEGKLMTDYRRAKERLIEKYYPSD